MYIKYYYKCGIAHNPALHPPLEIKNMETPKSTIQDQGKEQSKFVGIDDEARELLAGFSPVLLEHLPDILDGFYAHVGAWPALGDMVDPANRRIDMILVN